MWGRQQQQKKKQNGKNEVRTRSLITNDKLPFDISEIQNSESESFQNYFNNNRAKFG